MEAKKGRVQVGSNDDDERKCGVQNSNTDIEINPNHDNKDSVEEVSEKFDLMDIVAARCNNDQGETPNRLTKEEEKLLAYNKTHEASKNNKEEDSNSHDTDRQDGSRKRSPRINTGGDKDNNILDSIAQSNKNKNQNQVEESEEFDVMNVVRARARGELTKEMTKGLTEEEEEEEEEGRNYHDQFTTQNAEATLMVSPRPPPPPTRNQVTIPASTPGAYAGVPGRDLQCNNTLRFSLFGAPQHMDGAPESLGQEGILLNEEEHDGGQTLIPDTVTNTTTPEVGTTAEGSIRTLPAAALVHEESILDIDLQPVDVDAAEEKNSNNEKQRKLFIVISVILLSVALIIVVLGSIFGIRNKKSVEASNQYPSVVPSLAPSEMPSTSPTEVLHSMRAILPNYTVESLQDPYSPQSLAFDWLSSHQNISNLEEWRKVQLFALATIYYAFDGPNWPNGLNDDWRDDTRSECLWFSSKSKVWGGITDSFLGNQVNTSCNQDGELWTLNLQNAFDLGNQSVMFPREIALLRHLVEIDLSYFSMNVSLSNAIWPVLSSLPKLESLDLTGNSITGTIPQELGIWTKLTYLDIGYNSLTGTIPTEVALMTGLESISLASNGLFGAVPSELGSLSNLYMIDLDYCGLFGQIPSELGSLSNLVELYLMGNELFGSIPPQLASLTGLHSLRLSYNDLTGQIPSQLGLMTGLAYLRLNHNSLTGSMPLEVGLLRNLTGLRLENNYLTGTLSSEVGLMTSMGWLFLGNNLQGGQLPTELGLLGNVTQIGLEGNLFTGSIPTELGSLVSLQNLYLNGNSLAGRIPSELGSLTSLKSLHLNTNNLSGQIPSSWMSLDFNSSNKPDFDLTPADHFFLLGGFWEPDYLHTLDLRDNSLLTGFIPEELCMMDTTACAVYEFDWSEYQWTSQPCSFEFNCTETLCGCDCSCNVGINTSAQNTTSNEGQVAP